LKTLFHTEQSAQLPHQRMNSKPLGRLQKVDLREAWLSESSHFTPWLAQPENLKLLGEAIGIDLECEAQEKDVGPFRADILCKDTSTDAWVLIENQLERTDHSHLGQLLTYAAGLEAVSIVWIAQRFTDEHRAALDWLNQHTPEEINFFGLEVELWRIDNSPVAPKFNIVSKPNEWSRTIGESARNIEITDGHLQYWTELIKQPTLAEICKLPVKPTRKGNLNLPVGWINFKLSVFTNRSDKRLGVYIMCRGPRGYQNYEQLVARKDELERQLGAELAIEDGEEQNQGWLLLRLPKNDPLDQDDWPRQQKLLAEKTVEFYKCFASSVQRLDNGEPLIPPKDGLWSKL
jgi:hypothetical protein